MKLTEKFEKMGARVKVERLQPNPPRRPRWGVTSGTPPQNFIRLDVRKDRYGTYFDIQAGINVDLQVLDIKPKDRHLLLMTESTEGKSKFLCGHDERDWFVAAIPESSSASNVATAMEALKPTAVKEAQDQKKVKGKERKRRKTDAYIRQGEWFFIPCPNLKVDKSLVLKNEPLRRGRSKPHVAEFLYRIGGVTVWVNSEYPNGLTQKQYEKLCRDNPEAKKSNFTTMRRDPKVYVKGTIRHSDHKTVKLDFWHEVQPNTETQSKAMRQVAFLD